MPSKRIINYIFIGIIIAILFFIENKTFGQVRHRRLGSSKRNANGGYDFYGNRGRKTGYSRRKRRGGYEFYDSHQNKVGSLVPIDKSKQIYNYYDANGVKRGVLKKNREGSYRYKDLEDGKIVDSTPSLEGELGSISPGTFRGTNPE